MNLGKEPQTSIIESNGVSILKSHLQENGLIKCYFSEGDKTPNTDGFFVVNNEIYPLKEFHVQIKTTKKLRETKGMIVYSCDTKFINYANLRVTENPCFIFVVELTTQRIYFKYLSEKFLHNNDFTHSEQKSVSIHFNDKEILHDIQAFYRLVCDIIKYREILKFNPAGVDILEYQLAFNVLNNFFDRDFIKIKNQLYPGVWKFGIAYQRIPFDNIQYQTIVKERAAMGIEIVPYVSTFGAYAIEYGDEQQIFQNLNVFENDINLKLLHNISFTNGVSNSVEEAAMKWLNDTFDLWIANESIFIPYFPNDALFEIVYNFLDKNAFEFGKSHNAEGVIGNTISTKEAKKIITEKYPQEKNINSEITLLRQAIFEIERRNITTINRIWIFESTPTNHIRDIYYNSTASIINNNVKLLTHLPKYYDEFIQNLFDKSNVQKYAYSGNFKVSLEIELVNNKFKNEYRSIFINSDDFLVEIVDDLKDYTSRGWGMLNTSFRGDEHNILNNILSMLYKQVCKQFKFKENLSFTGKAFFN